MKSLRVLIVEGPDDEHVVKHICAQRNLGKIDKIDSRGGKENLLDGIGVRIKESNIGSLGIILDADTDLCACWQSIVHRLRKAGYPHVPDLPDPGGTVLPPHDELLLPRLGIWLMPNNELPGILEDFLKFLVPEDDQLLAHAEMALSNLPMPVRFTELRRPKALIHTWLAWQEEPGKPFGQAISARYLDVSLPSAHIFASWLQRTFFFES
jgi:hypothetical protein